MWRHIRNIAILLVIGIIGFGIYATRPDVAQVPIEKDRKSVV